MAASHLALFTDNFCVSSCKNYTIHIIEHLYFMFKALVGPLMFMTCLMSGAPCRLAVVRGSINLHRDQLVRGIINLHRDQLACL